MKSGLMKAKSLATLQQIWVPSLKLIGRRPWNKSTYLTKNGLLINVHVKEVGNVIMCTIGNLKRMSKESKFWLSHRKFTKLQ